MKNLDALINAIRYICVKANVAETTMGEICYQVRHSSVDTELNCLQSLLDGASAELPKLKVEMFKAAGDGRVFANVLEWQSGYPAWKQLAHMKAGDTFDIPQTVATLAIAKERALRKAAEETMVYQHKGLEEETTLREEAEASIAILEEELKQYKHDNGIFGAGA